MAEYEIVNPQHFVPASLYIQDGGDARGVRADLVFAGNPPREHEEYAAGDT